MMALLLVCSLPLAAFAEEYDLANGSISIEAKADGQYVTQGETSKNDNAPVITQSNNETATNNTVTITAAADTTANVTLKDLNIDTGTSGGAAIQTSGDGNVVIELDGTNTVKSGNQHAGVEKDNAGTLTITDTDPDDPGSLNATGGFNGAGIGGGSGGSGSNIIITGSAEVTAKGGENGSGIGGGDLGSGSYITISGSAQVDATGGFFGSGIGGGYGGTGSKITVSDNAQVDATGGEGGAGIGGGDGGTGSDITITGSAEVTATGGDRGAGIGSGSWARNISSNITISGNAEVTAKGGISGAGIGGGQKSASANITVSGNAQVKAQGGNRDGNWGAGAAIGDGGKLNNNSVNEVAPNTDALNEGWIAKYAPDAALNTTPGSLTYKDASGKVQTVTENITIEDAQPATADTHGHEAGFTVGDKLVAVTTHNYGDYVPQGDATCTQDGTKTATCTVPGCTATHTIPDPAKGHSFTNYISNNDGSKTAKCDHCDATDTITDPGSKLVKPDQSAPLYWVTGQDGMDVSCETERKDGVLTITVDADVASLTGYLGGLQTLQAQGIDTIVFVTNGATSTFALADLMATMTAGGSYTLTHDGSTTTFTLSNGTDIGSILK